MKKFSLLAITAALALTVSCEKPQSEAERNAQVEREVQQRLATERQAAEQQRLAQQQADLAAREQALADREAAASATPAATEREEPAVTTSRTTASAASSTDNDEPSSYDTFYRKLEPYGAWRETSDYGYVFQPQQAQRSGDWRPYTDGRWAYTDAGWTWVSEEPFGWATYHYGRWTRLRGAGWVWVPGEQWAPAWVSWRKSDEFVGWAPLPPEAHFDRQRGIQRWADSYYDIDAGEYVFIPNEAIGSVQLRQEVVPVQRNVTIINQTTNVTNITYNNTTIVNVGPNFDELRVQSRRPIERLRLERKRGAQEATPNAVVRGDVLEVSAPVFTAQAAERPRNVGDPIRQVTVDHSTTAGVNEADAERVRQKMKSEATPPPDAPPKRFNKPTVMANGAATPAPSATATAAPSASASSTPGVSATATTRPRATSTATPAPSASVTPHVRPSASVAPSASASPSIAPSATLPPRAMSPAPGKAPARAASPATSASPAATASPSASASPPSTPAADSEDVVAPPVSGRPDVHPRGPGAPRVRRPDHMLNPGAQPRGNPIPSAAPSASAPVQAVPVTPPRPRMTPPPRPSLVPLVSPGISPVATPEASAAPATAAPPARHPARAQTAPPSPSQTASAGAASPADDAPEGGRGPRGARAGKRNPPPGAGATATPSASPDAAPEQ